jgi:hypothetical protein
MKKLGSDGLQRISEKRNTLIDHFDPDAEILLIPRVRGGVDM